MFDVEDLTALNISLSDYLKTAAVNSVTVFGVTFLLVAPVLEVA